MNKFIITDTFYGNIFTSILNCIKHVKETLIYQKIILVNNENILLCSIRNLEYIVAYRVKYTLHFYVL